MTDDGSEAAAAAAASAASSSPSASPPSARRKLQPMESASHFTAAMQADDSEGKDDPTRPRRPSRWASLPSDLSRLALSQCCTPRQVWAASRVCKSWRHSLDHPSTWAALCAAAGWAVPATAARAPGGVRAFFVERYRTVRHYSRCNWRQQSWAAHAAGILHLAVPPAKRFFSWSAGGVERVDEQILISAASAPTYGLKVWRLGGGAGNKAGADGPPECLNEQHVYGNPMLAHADGSEAAAGHPLDPVSSGLRSHWSCVDVYTSAMIDDADVEGEGGYAPFAQAASSSSSESCSCEGRREDESAPWFEEREVIRRISFEARRIRELT